MKALSLWQPWASLISDGRKTIETRHWPMSYRGPLAIHAAKKVDKEACREFGYDPETIPRGCVVCIVNVDNCVRFPNPLAPPDAYGDFHEGRYGFILSKVETFPPIPVKGMQGIWEWELVPVKKCQLRGPYDT
jgi:activating signal cointegrator 1